VSDLEITLKVRFDDGVEKEAVLPHAPVADLKDMLGGRLVIVAFAKQPSIIGSAFKTFIKALREEAHRREARDDAAELFGLANHIEQTARTILSQENVERGKALDASAELPVAETDEQIVIAFIKGRPSLEASVRRFANDPWKAPEQRGHLTFQVATDALDDATDEEHALLGRIRDRKIDWKAVEAAFADEASKMAP
jgi:hypothetical protein